MWLLGYRFHCALITLVCLTTLLTIALGNAYAEALIDPAGGIRPGFFDKEVLQNLRLQDLLSPALVLYSYPIIAVLIAHRLPLTRLVFIALSLLPMWFELYALGGGGDRKGCEVCGLSLFFYGLAFPLLYLPTMGIALGLHCFRSHNQPADPKQTRDRILAASAGLFSLLMLGVLWRYIGW